MHVRQNTKITAILPFERPQMLIIAGLSQLSIASGMLDGYQTFVCSTQEGALWMGMIQEESIDVFGYTEIQSDLGAAFALSSERKLVVAAHNLYEYRV